MNKRKLQFCYVFILLLLLVIFSNSSYTDIGKPSFVIPVILGSLIIGVIGVYLFGKGMKLYKNLYFISYIMTILFAFIPNYGVYMEDGISSYGFPAQWFIYYSSGYVSLEVVGFLFNFFIIYLILRFLTTIFLRFSSYHKLSN